MAGKPPHLTVVANADELAEAAAQRISAHLTQASGRLAACLTGGSTPERLYKFMATEPYRDALPWQRIHWFWGDERFVPHDDRRSNFGMARRMLLGRIPVPADNIHAIPTSAASVADATLLYEAELRRFYGAEQFNRQRPLFDVVLMGVGADGHTASLFPGRPELDESQRWVVGVPEAGLEPFVPRVTLTLPALASTRAMLFLVSGRSKREVVRRVLSGADLPATRAYSHGELVWLVDRDAAPEHRDVA